MRTQENEIAKILNLKEGKTEKDVIDALAKSELIMDGPIECMHRVGAAAFHIISTSKDLNSDLAKSLFPLERLFEFYYKLATEYNTSK